MDKFNRLVHCLIQRTLILTSKWFFVRSQHEMHQAEKAVNHSGCLHSGPQGTFHSCEKETSLSEPLSADQRDRYLLFSNYRHNSACAAQGSALKLQPERDLITSPAALLAPEAPVIGAAPGKCIEGPISDRLLCPPHIMYACMHSFIHSSIHSYFFPKGRQNDGYSDRSEASLCKEGELINHLKGMKHWGL